MNEDQIRLKLIELGFEQNQSSSVETLEKKEGHLLLSAQIGVIGLFHEGLQINGFYWDGRTLYDSEGMLDLSVMQMGLNPRGFLGPNPTMDEILDRMEEIREKVGLGNPIIMGFRDAINNGDLATVRGLLKDNLTLLKNRKHGSLRRSFLHNINNRPIAKELISAGFGINSQDRLGNTPLHYAGSPGIALDLLKAGADPSTKNSEGNPPLLVMIQSGRLMEAVVLLSLGGNPNEQNKRGQTGLHIANNEKTVKLLLDYGADPNLPDELGRTPLHYINSAQLGQILVSGGAVIKYDLNGALPIHTARTISACDFFMGLGLSLSKLDHELRTPLYYAVLSRNTAIVKYLLDKGVNINTQDRNGLTALHLVDDARVAEILISAGTDIMARDSQFKTPLHYSSNAGVVKLLIESGADLHARDVQGRTVLHRECQPRIVSMLIGFGADANAQDKEGKFPIDYPQSCRTQAILKKEMNRKK